MATTNGLTGNEHLTVMQEASRAYARFLAPFIAPDMEPQLIAFGSDSTFDPLRLEIAAVDGAPNGWIVKFSIKHQHLDFHDDYEAAIEAASGGKLLLKQVWYLDPFPENGQERLAYL